MKRLTVGFAATMVVAIAVVPVQAQQTSFLYQGRLDQSGAPVNAVMDFRFTLWDALNAGNQVNSSSAAENIQVSDGLFEAEVDFGAGALDGSPRWLQIEVRPDGGGSYTIMTPRQPLTPAPYAQYAMNGGADGPWQITGADITYTNGDVGVGVPSPQARLHVNGSGGLSLNVSDQLFVNETQGFVGINRSAQATAAEVFGILADTDSYGGMYITTTGAAGQPFYGYGADGSTMWTYYEGGTSKWHVYNDGAHVTVQNDGRVGIGKTAPGARLHVGGVAGSDGIMFPDGTLQTTAAGETYWDAGSGNIFATNTGNVGIGDTTPDAKLDVEGSSRNGYLGGSANGAYGENPDWTYGLLGGTSYGVYGRRVPNGNYGYFGGAGYGAYGENGTSGNFGRLGTSNEGVAAKHESTDNWGYLATADYGVHGTNPTENTEGYIAGNNGLYGANTAAGTNGAVGHDFYGAIGVHTSGSYGFLGSSTHGVFGTSTSATGAGGLFTNTGGGLALQANGRARVDVIEIVGGSDLAEPFDINSDEIESKPGMVVSIDPEGTGELVVSRKACDRAVAGVISGAGGINPGMVMSQTGTEADGSVPVALTGRVRVWCDATAGAITPGDLLTTSDRPGHAMKVHDYDRAQGAIIGKAMSALAEGETGLVLVLVNLQ